DVYFYPVQFICEDDAWRQAEVTIPNYLGPVRTFAITFMPLTFDDVEHTFADGADYAKYEQLMTTYAWPGYGQFETPFISLSSISVEESEVELELADQYEIGVVFDPVDATNQNVTYSSSDPSVAIVTVDGVIQPLSAGTTEITVTSDYGFLSAKIDVTVVELKIGETFESEGIVYSVESVDPYQVVVVGYEGAIKDVELPEYVTYKGYDLAVTEIGTKAFYGCKTLKSIDLGNVTKVGVKAFVRCSNLESVNGGDSLATISAYAFFKCTKLVNIDLYDAAETLRIYGSYAFYGCDNLGEIIVPSYMTHITSNAFTLPFYDQSGNELDVSADSLKGYPYANINAQFVQQPVAAIGTVFEDDTFEYTISSILPNFVEITGYVGSSSDVLVSEKVAYEDCDYKIFGIGEGVFKDNKSITSIVAPDVRSVGKLAFYGCSHLKDAVLPGAEKIGVKAFAYCRALEDIEIDSLKNVQAYTFYRCTSLDTVVLNGITNIGTAAFYQCTSLEIVDLGDSVAKVLKNAFTGCNKLELVEFSPTLTWISSSAFGSTEFQDMDGNTVSSAEDLCGKTFIGTDGVLTETVPNEDD
ncbi:MAG: leucine-rich repeat protein, partial [Candidatus Methanomethylophilaceae archaeon]|nr:leucine-rich repeat protein [Candidatus Methanomethylophilaceae archaeon]